jgi:2-polyprenyl-3-methyl-5-hydroxy-6-metoxy-1,4-benzoquinol methylase
MTVDDGLRFGFGNNWTRFLAQVDEDRIAAAEQSLVTALGRTTLDGVSFLDVGSGSGLLSLAARRLGARVHSFDYDPQSVACTAELRRRYRPDDEHWIVEQGSALDADYLEQLGRFDIVYSWGVLHHTGSMWEAIDLVAQMVNDDGQLFIAIYNDQGVASERWTAVKRRYNAGGRVTRGVLLGGVGAYFAVKFAWKRTVGRSARSRSDGAAQTQQRGMSYATDLVDWVGGYPFEVAEPDAITQFLGKRGFTVRTMLTCGRKNGCNEFVFDR